MKRYLLMILVGIAVSAAAAHAARCFRPAQVPACPTPAPAPRCYMIDTQASASYISCFLCHDYKHRRIG